MDDVDKLRYALRRVIDPEAGLNIVDLGLVYGLEKTTLGVRLDLSLTSPACPMGETIAVEAEQAMRECLPADAVVDVKLVWEPPWTPERMSARARDLMGWES